MKPKLSLLLLIALAGFPQISETIYTPALPNVAMDLMASIQNVESTLAIYFLGFAVGVMIWGTISDSWGRRSSLLAGLVIYGVSTLACGMVQGVEALLFWRFVQAFGASVGSVICQTMTRDLYEGQERVKIFSTITGALAFSPALGPVIGGYLSEYLGWRFNFWSLTLLAIILIIWCLKTLPETLPNNIVRPNKKSIGSLFTTMITSKNLWGHIILISATNGILFSFYQEAPFVFIDQLGMRPSHYGLLGLLIAAATILSSRISYKLSHSSSSESLITYGAIASVIGGVFFTALVAGGFFTLNFLPLTIASLFGTFFGIGLIIPNSLSKALKPFQNMGGTAGSIFGGSYYLFIALFTWGMSFLHNNSPLPLPLYITFLGIVLLFASRMVKTQYPEGVLT